MEDLNKSRKVDIIHDVEPESLISFMSGSQPSALIKLYLKDDDDDDDDDM
jgi:hypothetical protein